jgi:signal recognition particle subunit SEC65
MTKYVSMANAIRSIFEAAKPTGTAHGALAPDGGPERDMNDQIAVGSYQTKSFEMSDKAQKLYSNLSKDIPGAPAEAAAIELDRIFDLFRDARAKGSINPNDLLAAATSEKKVRVLAKEMGLENEHNDILADIMRHLTDYAYRTPERFINPEDHVHPSDDPRFKTDSKVYSTDKANDRDVDNVKNFLIRRSLKAQRKLKIIDND